MYYIWGYINSLKNNPQGRVSTSHSTPFIPSAEGKDPTYDPFTWGWTIWPHRGARTTGHRQTTGPSVSSVIWATVQPGRNHGKGPGKRWVYCPSILLDVTDAHCLTGGLVFWIFWEHPEIPMCSVTLLDQHSEMRLCEYVSHKTYTLKEIISKHVYAVV